VLTGQGVGSSLGIAVLPAISDRFGRKPVMIVALIVELAALWALMVVGANAVALFVALFVATFMNFGVVGINMGPLTTASVPAAVSATATGLVIGVGEIFGGGLAPVIAGGIADAMGIPVVIKIAIAAVVLALVNLMFGVREPKSFAQL
jgi:MFS family permease